MSFLSYLHIETANELIRKKVEINPCGKKGSKTMDCINRTILLMISVACSNVFTVTVILLYIMS